MFHSITTRVRLFAAGTGSAFVGTGVGLLRLDGNGIATVTANTWVKYQGSSWSIDHSLSSGPYSVDNNCIVTATMTDQTGSTGKYLFVFNPDGTGGQFTRLDTPGAVLSGFEAGRGTGTCRLSALSSTFAINLSGTIVGTGPAGYIGLIAFDGKGGISGTLSVNLNGVATEVSALGTYTVNSDCTGSAFITPSGFSAMNLNFVVVNSAR